MGSRQPPQTGNLQVTLSKILDVAFPLGEYVLHVIWIDRPSYLRAHRAWLGALRHSICVQYGFATREIHCSASRSMNAESFPRIAVVGRSSGCCCVRRARSNHHSTLKLHSGQVLLEGDTLELQSAQYQLTDFNYQNINDVDPQMILAMQANALTGLAGAGVDPPGTPGVNLADVEGMGEAAVEDVNVLDYQWFEGEYGFKAEVFATDDRQPSVCCGMGVRVCVCVSLSVCVVVWWWWWCVCVWLWGEGKDATEEDTNVLDYALFEGEYGCKAEVFATDDRQPSVCAGCVRVRVCR